ncbi:DUF1800 family protein [Lacihabitans soyangensis]|uniref:DUF1800 family protein n=1 Tax=Lacihabitans soyangensis TaxID=869394 RepID=A0AAE3KT40_9BACT|nr:DUF1800 family protein [Lacihabitans soyangensis]MCP9763718.1 DUF1800 family protein [Lacihabitans soyangensis]
MASLTEKNSLLGFDNALHLLRRATYAPNKTNVSQFSNYTPTQALDALFSTPNYAVPEPLATDTSQKYIPTFLSPSVAPTSMDDYDRYYMVYAWWFHRAQNSNTIHSKIIEFLHTIFVTNNQNERYQDFTFDYMSLLEFYASGSIKTLAKKMSRLNVMHFYLDNRLNTAGAPNENYAREFLELFTILKGPQDGPGSYTNYTEQDVQQAARVLTGFTNILESERLSYLDSESKIPLGKKVFANHDTGNKTFSAKFNNQTINGATSAASMDTELDAFINMVFNQPATAKSYARRIYRYFVSRNITSEIENDIITPLADHLYTNDYNIQSTIKLLLKSRHFYDEDDSLVGDEIIGAKIKSPLELVLTLYSQFNITGPNQQTNTLGFLQFYFYFLWYRASLAGQNIFQPTNVAGYPPITESPNYDKLWINSSNLRYRYSLFIDDLIKGISIPNTPIIVFDTVHYVRNSGNFSSPANANVLLNEFFELCLVEIPTGVRYIYFSQALLGNLSAINWQNEWNNYLATNDSTSVRIALDRFIRTLVKSPEYQLL